MGWTAQEQKQKHEHQKLTDNITTNYPNNGNRNVLPLTLMTVYYVQFGTSLELHERGSFCSRLARET